jgi:putative SOS response-associated peptidase YedK
MCGRFTRDYTWHQIWEMYNLTSTAANLQPRYNICPTTTIDTVIEGDGERTSNGCLGVYALILRLRRGLHCAIYDVARCARY